MSELRGDWISRGRVKAIRPQFNATSNGPMGVGSWHKSAIAHRLNECSRLISEIDLRFAIQPLVKHHDPHVPNNEHVFAQTAEMSGAAMPGRSDISLFG